MVSIDGAFVSRIFSSPDCLFFGVLTISDDTGTLDSMSDVASDLGFKRTKADVPARIVIKAAAVISVFLSGAFYSRKNAAPGT